MELRQFRALVGVTLEELAQEVGSHKGTISKVERGICVPGGDLLLRITGWAENQRKRKRLPRTCQVTWTFEGELQRESSSG